MASTLLRLLRMYESRDFQVRTGLNPAHLRGVQYAPFTALFRDGRGISTGGGLSLQEIYFLEILFEGFRPRNLFVIGNAFGWSTLLLALLNPEARVVALDAGIEGDDNDLGNRLTREIAEQEGLDVRVVLGRSPGDVEQALRENLDSPPEFVLIDGLHTPEQMTLDFEAVQPLAARPCFFAFHDVVNFSLLEAFRAVAATQPAHRSELLLRTPSGMAVLYDTDLAPLVEEPVRAFTEPFERVRHLREGLRRRDLRQNKRVTRAIDETLRGL